MNSESMAGPVKILLVDDQSANLTALEAALSGFSYELILASSGHEAYEQAKLHDFAVILLDVQMPQMDGFETAKLIRRHERSQFTPIIFVTANYPNEAYALQGYEAGAVDYLHKPLNVEILRAKVAIFVELFISRVDIRRLRATEKELRKAIETRDEFLSIASHELRTPLTPLQLQMQGFIRMLETGKMKEVPIEQLKKMLVISDSQVARLSRLIDQLLDVSRINEGRLKLETEEGVDLSEVVETVTQQFQNIFENAECTVKLNLTPGIRGNWDRLRIEQVVINLFVNAIKYGPGKPIEVTTSCSGDRAALVIKDQGMGITEKDHERIFERFERAVCARSFGGLGLGLFITRQILELHRGAITVQSKPDAGATFRIELPLSNQ